MLQQKIVNQVRANQIVPPIRTRPELRQICPADSEPLANAVSARVLLGNSDRLSINVICIHWRITKPGRCDCENSRPSTQVQEGWLNIIIPKPNHLLDAEACRRMLP